MDFSFYYIIKFLKQAHGKTSLAYANEYPREYKELKLIMDLAVAIMQKCHTFRF